MNNQFLNLQQVEVQPGRISRYISTDPILAPVVSFCSKFSAAFVVAFVLGVSVLALNTNAMAAWTVDNSVTADALVTNIMTSLLPYIIGAISIGAVLVGIRLVVHVVFRKGPSAGR